MTEDEPLILPAASRSKRLSLIAILVLIAITLAMVVVGYAVIEVANDRDGWRTVALDLRHQLSDQSDELVCRAQANLDTDRAAAEMQIVIGEGLAAVARNEDLTTYLADLDVAVQNLRDALALRQTSLGTCADKGAPSP